MVVRENSKISRRFPLKPRQSPCCSSWDHPFGCSVWLLRMKYSNYDTFLHAPSFSSATYSRPEMTQKGLERLDRRPKTNEKTYLQWCQIRLRILSKIWLVSEPDPKNPNQNQNQSCKILELVLNYERLDIRARTGNIRTWMDIQR